MRAEAIPHEGSPVAEIVTTSIGVASAWPARDDIGPATPEALLRRADEALYAAKGGGRNRYSTATESACDTAAE